MWLTPAAVSKKTTKTPCSHRKSGRSGERAGGRHTRTGCITCKIRHIKCDEEKPACYQCRKTGRVCDGYASAKPRVTTQASLVPEALQTPNQAIARLDYGLSGSNQERRSFEIFECAIGKDIMRAFNTTLTHQLILQAGHSNDAIKHAVVALGSLGEHLIERKVLIMQAARGDGRLNFARLQYLRAVRQLQESISGHRIQPLELILSCCFLLTIFDFLCGDDSMAQVHLKAGLNILHNYYSETARNQTWQRAPDLDQSRSLVYDLSRIFSVMDLHAAVWLGLSSFHSRPLVPPQTTMDISPPIKNIDLTLDDISVQLNYQLMRAHVFRHSVAINESNHNTFIAPFHILAEKHRLLHELQQWPMMLEKFLSLRTEPAADAIDRRIILMRMNYHSTLISLSTFLQTITSSPSIDSLIVESATTRTTPPSTSSFSEILSLARLIIHPASSANRTALLQAVAANAGEVESTMSNNSISGGSNIPLFAFVAGAIQPLYLTAVKCQDLRMCEMAISMLEEAPWREGAWDGAVMARIARRSLRDRFGVGLSG